MIKLIYKNSDEEQNREIQNLEEILEIPASNENKYIIPNNYMENNLYPKPKKRKLSEIEKILEAIDRGIDPETGARIIMVPQHYLPEGNGWQAIGLYNSSTHTIYVSQDMSKYNQIATCAHEIEHAKGEFNEYFTEEKAQARLKYAA